MKEFNQIIQTMTAKTCSQKFKKFYLIKVYVKKWKAFFKSTVKIFDENNIEVIGDISRIDKYGNQSHCIHNPILGKYCFCKDLV
jgi:hypothetical protein